MTYETILRRISNNTMMFDMTFNTIADTSDGWKLSLQGKSCEDAATLYSLLHKYLYSNNIPFKVATILRVESSLTEQNRKVMTIYIPNNMDVNDVAEEIYSLTIDYKGWYNIKTPTSYRHYAGCVFIGNDMVGGKYVPATQRLVVNQ